MHAGRLFVEHDAEGINVALWTHASTRRLLRSHVGRGSGNSARCFFSIEFEQACEAEIGNDRPWMFSVDPGRFVGDEYIRGL